MLQNAICPIEKDGAIPSNVRRNCNFSGFMMAGQDWRPVRTFKHAAFRAVRSAKASLAAIVMLIWPVTALRRFQNWLERAP